MFGFSKNLKAFALWILALRCGARAMRRNWFAKPDDALPTSSEMPSDLPSYVPTAAPSLNPTGSPTAV
jgi:hypothetical protein